MNYSNFGSRISRPIGLGEKTEKNKTTAARKPRKNVRRQALPTAAAAMMILMTSLSHSGASDAGSAMFSSGLPSHHASKLTTALLLGGIGVALFQARWLFRSDLSC